MTELSTVFFMFVNSEMIVTETESIAHIELQLNALPPKENLKYYGNAYHSNITTDPSGGTNSWVNRQIHFQFWEHLQRSLSLQCKYKWVHH